jgi:hypothetical protein
VGFKLMGTKRHGPMICAFGFTRKEALGHRSPSPLLLVHLRDQVSERAGYCSPKQRSHRVLVSAHLGTPG